MPARAATPNPSGTPSARHRGEERPRVHLRLWIARGTTGSSAWGPAVMLTTRFELDGPTQTFCTSYN